MKRKIVKKYAQKAAYCIWHQNMIDLYCCEKGELRSEPALVPFLRPSPGGKRSVVSGGGDDGEVVLDSFQHQTAVDVGQRHGREGSNSHGHNLGFL